MNRSLRTALLMLMVLALHSVTYAKVVDYSEAVKVATDFFRTNNMLSATSDVKEVWNSTQLSQTGVATMSATSSPVFYIFAPENSKGFVIVSADDATLPILAYSLTDEIFGDEMPCGLQWWCEAMAGEIAQLRASGIESPRKAAFNGIATLADDELYLETPSWDQGSPYNQECPLYNGSRCYTGCGPTATAEVMRYYKYPDSGTGSTDAYTTSSNKIYVESRNLEHKIDWDNMPYSYSSYTDEQATAVATLMADIGAIYTADYGTDGTGIATSPSTLSRIYNHYGYSWRIVYTLAEAYDDAGWTALMKEQLQTCGPVLYRGTSDSGGGHMFVLDGYNTSNYFHINWGWSGSSDGYFLLPSITYHINQAAMLNFMPDDGTTPESTLQVYGDGMTASRSHFEKGVSFTMSVAGIYNNSVIDFYGDYAYALVDEDDNIKEIISDVTSRTSALSPNYLLLAGDKTCTITVDMDDTDCIRLVYRDTSTSDWKLMGPRSANTVYMISIGEQNLDDNDYVMKMYSPGLSADTDIFHQYYSFTANAYAINRSGETVDRTNFRFALTDSEGKVKQLISSLIYVDNFRNNYYASLTGVLCTITSEMEVGDWICLVYQNNATEDDGWKVVEPDSESIPWKIELTEDNIGEPIEDPECSVMMSSPGLVLSTDLFYKGVTFTSDFHPSNHSGVFVETYLRIGLADSSGKIKEWISDYQYFDVEPDYRRDYTDVPCTITGDVAVGDRIGMYYEKIMGDEDTWALPTLNGSGFPIEVEITEDMIASTSFTITSAGYATYYTNVEYTMPEDVKGTIVTGVEDEAEGDGGYILDMTWDYASGSTVPANTPLVLKGEPNTYEVTVTSTGANAPTNNLLLGSTTETVTYGPDTSASYLFYALSDGEHGVGFYYGVEGGGAFTSEANKAWLALTPEQAHNAKFIGFGDDVTGISSIKVNYGETDAIYTIQGLRVNDMKHKGIYIVNGKKVLVK